MSMHPDTQVRLSAAIRFVADFQFALGRALGAASRHFMSRSGRLAGLAFEISQPKPNWGAEEKTVPGWEAPARIAAGWQVAGNWSKGLVPTLRMSRPRRAPLLWRIAAGLDGWRGRV